MLQSFRFANHRSFADEQQLNLTPIYDSGDERAESRPSVLVTGIFGANASGKSNAIHAFQFMRRMVTSSDRAVEPGLAISIPREPFKLSIDIARTPSRYVVDLSLDGVRHTYGFTINDEGIVEEWLFHYPLKKKRRVFERDGENFVWGEESRKQSDLERISNITAPTALFISTVARFNRRASLDDQVHQPLHDVYRWFFRSRVRTRPDLPLRNFASIWSDLGSSRDVIVDLMRAADVGIVDVAVQTETQDSLFDVEEFLSDSTTNTTQVRRRLLFTHKGPSGDGILSLENESTGTRRLLDLAYVAASVLRIGGIMMVDEIDSSLHPILTAKLIGLFRSPASNPRLAQLVFSSHDATLLGTLDAEEVLGRDEIWFTEKSDDGTSTLYPLADFKPRREGENRQRRYLNGNYGGVPEISTYLFEKALASRMSEVVEGSDGA
ncbi:ATP-binding protein [Dactylosporangium aurantiacum]|uniref:ATP-binding protein n=1 Tax=Dactylosporangium aurantiacum TaxID=35754 RepID=A0A9Q9IGM4_9ACTN|nr:ATP-binding protein [Dactylosporangium aurantiacum]MDG6108150.1 ATP-binding protein [Dactylosporangium aurantiacum]UWZ53855.1 ATP-binding protein [Dactylosporangium aurantiacum]